MDRDSDRRADLAERVAGFALFRGCTPRERRIVARHLDVVGVAAGTTLLRRGDPALTVFFLLDGQAVVEDGRLLGPGDHVGELALLAGVPSTVTVRARTELTVAALGARMFRVLTRELPAVEQALTEDLARRLLASSAT